MKKSHLVLMVATVVFGLGFSTTQVAQADSATPTEQATHTNHRLTILYRDVDAKKTVKKVVLRQNANEATTVPIRNLQTKDLFVLWTTLKFNPQHFMMPDHDTTLTVEYSPLTFRERIVSQRADEIIVWGTDHAGIIRFIQGNYGHGHDRAILRQINLDDPHHLLKPMKPYAMVIKDDEDYYRRIYNLKKLGFTQSGFKNVNYDKHGKVTITIHGKKSVMVRSK